MFLYISSITHLNGKLFISCMLYLLYPSVIVFIFFIVNKQTTSIPRTFEKLATPLAATSPEATSVDHKLAVCKCVYVDCVGISDVFPSQRNPGLLCKSAI